MSSSIPRGGAPPAAPNAPRRSLGTVEDVFYERRLTGRIVHDGGRVAGVKAGSEQGSATRLRDGARRTLACTSEIDDKVLRDLDAQWGERPAETATDAVPAVVEVLDDARRAAQAVDPAVADVRLTYGWLVQHVAVRRFDDVMVVDVRPQRWLGARVIARNRRHPRASSRFLGTNEFPPRANDVVAMATSAAAAAVQTLSAVPAPRGTLPVVLAPGSGGVFFHESCGHALEGDIVANGGSVFCGSMGRRVATDLLTVVDDPTVPGLWNSLAIDDEGMQTRPTRVIERGRLVDFLRDRSLEDSTRLPTTGHARRQSYRHSPAPRMTTTYVVAGDDDPADVVGRVAHGVYVGRIAGGQVYPADGTFVFGVAEGNVIQDGVIGDPIDATTLRGRTPQCLDEIVALGNDLAFHPAICDKDGQKLPVSVGCPTVLLRGLAVGEQ